MDALLRESEVLAFVPYKKSTLWRLVKAGKFPAPRQVGPHRVGWLASEVADWIQNRPIAAACAPPDLVSAA